MKRLWTTMLKRVFGGSSERGQILMVVVLIIIPLTAAVGIVAVDMSSWQSERRGAQKDADLAALAGAYELMNAGATVAQAQTAAMANQGTNDEAGNAQIAPSGNLGDIIVDNSCFNTVDMVNGVPTPHLDSVSLNVRHKARVFFGEVFGIKLAPDVGAHARACAGSLISMKGVMPVGLPVCPDPLDPACNLNKFARTLCWSPDDNGDGLPQPLYGTRCDLSVFDKVSGEASWLDLDNTSPFPNPPTRDCWNAGGGASELTAEIKAGGANTWCRVAPAGYTAAECQSAAIPPVNWCVKSKTGASPNPIMDAFKTLFSTEGACDTTGDGIDDFSASMQLMSGTEGTDSAFYKEICKSPRLITVIVVDNFDATGNNFMLIRAFASFFVEACTITDNAGVVTEYPKCDPQGNIGHAMLTGRFVNIVGQGEVGAPSDWSPKGIRLDQ